MHYFPLVFLWFIYQNVSGGPVELKLIRVLYKLRRYICQNENHSPFSFPYIASLSRSCFKCCASIWDFIAIYAMVLFANSRIVEFKRNYLNFHTVNWPFICSNIPAAPAYGVYISQLIRYYRACGSYQDFLDRRLLPIRKLQNQGFLLVKL